MKKKFINSNNIYIVGDIGNTDTKIFLLNHKFVKTRKIFLKTRLISNIYMNKHLKIVAIIRDNFNPILWFVSYFSTSLSKYITLIILK